MKVSLRWLRDYVDCKLTEAELAERLTLAGLEVAGVQVFGLPVPPGLRVKPEDAPLAWDREKIVTARITRIDPHPDADRLKLPTVEYGPGLTKQLVTGAPNVSVGQTNVHVVLALNGSELFDGHAAEKKKMVLKPTKIRGVPSDAMVCSYRELGVGEDHEGIIILEDGAPVGMPLADFMGDIVLEVDVLPNMARCLSMLGMAREVAALTGQPLKLPPAPAAATGKPIAGQVNVEIENARLCARYSAMLLSNVKVGPSPGWMQRRLMFAGMRPINNLVDITNYVMLEWGQPLHAFDFDKLAARAGGKTPTVIVRAARAGETLVTLDNQKRELTPDMLVIADNAGPIALAGVMGGLETEVSDGTTRVLLESASFDFLSIRRTMKALNLPSEASVRFSKGIHPELVLPTAARAADLMRQFAGATVAQGLVDNYPAPLPAQVIELPLAAVTRTLGMELPEAEVTRILKALEYDVKPAGAGRLRVTVPEHRLDVQAGVADLIEDVARVHGYSSLPSTLLSDQLPRQRADVDLHFEEWTRDILVSTGLQEVITYALTQPEREAPLGHATREYVRLLNPISSERVVMRQTVLAGVLEVAASNLRNTDDVRLFEVGPVYLARPGEKLPDEPRRLALVVTGKRRQEFWTDSTTGLQATDALDFYDLKGVVEALVADLHLPGVAYAHSKAPYLHPARAAELRVGDKVLGHFGELHPKAVKAFGLGERTVLVAELDLELMQAALPPRYAYVPVPRFPPALRDIALVLPEETPNDRVEQEIRAGGGELLRHVRLFDLYRGESIAAGTKSLAYALSYQADDRTLTDKEVDKAHKKIEDRLKHVLKAAVRGKE